MAVGLSGGVDSSVAAALLLDQGLEVVGVTLKIWDESRCCSLSDADDARAVARTLGIPHFTIDAREAFEESVVLPFVSAYGAGLTPNPCVACNRRLKFSWLLDRVRVLGCEKLATGHYARIGVDAKGEPLLLRGLDHAKDQSYFVAPESREVLANLLFPLGGLAKGEVRKIAEAKGLPVAGKPDSQDLCFLPEGGLAQFLSERLGEEAPGEVVDLSGRVLGAHRGVSGYTVGQRKGLGIASTEPLYVLRREVENNRVVLAPREALNASRFFVEGFSWLIDPPKGGALECLARTRSTGRLTQCVLRAEGANAEVELSTPQFAVTPGQLAVFYLEDAAVGAGIISERL